MTDERVELTFKEKLSLFGYGYRLVQSSTPTFLPFSLIRALITSAQPLLVLFFSARILTELDGAKETRAIVTYVCLTVGLTFILLALKAILTRELESYSSWQFLHANLLRIEAEQFTKMDFAYAEDAKISEALARMDVHAMGNGLGLMDVYYHTERLAESVFSLVLAIVLLTGLSMGGVYGIPALALCALFILSLFVSMLLNKREGVLMERIYVESSKANTIGAFYQGYIGPDEAAKDVRLYDQKAALRKILRESFNAAVWIPIQFAMSHRQGFTLGILAVVSGGFYMLNGYGALEGDIPVGSIIQNVGAVLALAGAIGAILSTFGRLWNNTAFLRPMREFMTLPDMLVKGNKPVADAEGHDYEIEFCNVSFKYPGADVYALRNLNLKLSPGERLAVVGLNGSGKTTMVKLLCRLYDPTEGDILLDGVNIKEYDYEQYIALFSVVFQDYAIFPIWLGQNVAAREMYDAGKAEECLVGAGFSERLDSMPDRLDTVLFKEFDEDGAQISGGEAQKIALARALYKNAPVVVLDEPTAALDPIAEYEVYTTFDKTIGGKTAVFISHRLSSCRFCHRVAVFDGGSLVQVGSHEKLLEDTAGRYHELWEAQASHYREEGE